MFLFTFIGGLLSPYNEAQLFMKEQMNVRDWAFATRSDILSVIPNEGVSLPSTIQAAVSSAVRGGQISFSTGGENFFIEPEHGAWLIHNSKELGRGRLIGERVLWGEDVDNSIQQALSEAAATGAESVSVSGKTYLFSYLNREIAVSETELAGIATTLVVSPLRQGFAPDFILIRAVEEARVFGSEEAEGCLITEPAENTLVISENGEAVALMSEYSIMPRTTGEIIPLEISLAVIGAINAGDMEFTTGGAEYRMELLNGAYSIKTEQLTSVVSLFEYPSERHWLGTDGHGMDVVTRLMYGGRVSLMVGFIVIGIGAVIGVVLGGLAGYFGKWADMIIMRLVDVFNCIPTIPLYLIIGAVMESNQVDARIRIYYLMLLMGVMNWPYIARVVRGQILMLREQEFMMACEALGIRSSRRIFRHLVPNVIPQLIVIMTMGLGDVILAESVLSFLGMGVKFPLASWGNILNAVNDMHIMSTYLSVWIPAGFLILMTVLGFNFIGDGLRDAFDPKTKR
jgi:peptide/nickel transport system permease protein